ncbi:MAG: MBL fold metallo-hydrolase [Desulfobulbaceae bacterium]|nr:MBL fold metallo-hydrolase [Desulfobulbaceae bacterium]
MKRRTFLKALIFSSGAFWLGTPNLLAAGPGKNSTKILMIYNNIGSSNSLVDDWGLSLWIEDKDTAVMFDTGADPTILEGNMETAGVDLQKLSTIVISHNHWDHINGLPAILEKSAKKLNIFVPEADLKKIKSRVSNATVTGINKPVQIAEKIWSTGQLKGMFRGEPIYEQSIIVTQNESSFLFTGCSHDKCLEGYFKLLILIHSPDFLFLLQFFWSKALKIYNNGYNNPHFIRDCCCYNCCIILKTGDMAKKCDCFLRRYWRGSPRY